MKRIFSFILLGALLAGVSCQKFEQASAPVDDEMGVINITLEGVDAFVTTRATTAEANSDRTAQTTQIFIFDSGGNFVKKLTAASSVSLSKGVQYTAAALLNGTSLASPSLSELQSTVLDLATTDHYRAMYGTQTYDLRTAATASGSITCNHLAARVHLASITNNLPTALGAITLTGCYLSNAKGRVQVNGDAVTYWYNAYGRSVAVYSNSPTKTSTYASESSPGATWLYKSFSSASVAHGATYSTINPYFYCYPNACETTLSDMSASTDGSLYTTPQATWITVVGTVGGNTYYWTYNIGAASPNTTGLVANYTYDVTMTINNLGSSNPATPVTTGSATITTSAGAWTDGGSVSATI